MPAKAAGATAQTTITAMAAGRMRLEGFIACSWFGGRDRFLGSNGSRHSSRPFARITTGYGQPRYHLRYERKLTSDDATRVGRLRRTLAYLRIRNCRRDDVPKPRSDGRLSTCGPSPGCRTRLNRAISGLREVRRFDRIGRNRQTSVAPDAPCGCDEALAIRRRGVRWHRACLKKRGSTRALRSTYATHSPETRRCRPHHGGGDRVFGAGWRDRRRMGLLHGR